MIKAAVVIAYILAIPPAVLQGAPAGATEGTRPYKVGREAFLEDFGRFARHYNPWIQDQDARRQGMAIWVGSWCNAERAKKVACLGAQESRYRLLAYMPDADPGGKLPRTDALGMHYDFLCQALADYGLIPAYCRDWWKGARHSPDWIAWKEYLVKRPDVGTLLGALKFCIFSRDPRNRWAEDGAIRVWKTGKFKPTPAGDEHVECVRKIGKVFEKYRRVREGNGENKTEEVYDEEVSFDPGGALAVLGVDAPRPGGVRRPGR